MKAGDGPPGDLMAELQVELPEDLSESDRAQLAAVAEKYRDNPRANLQW